MKRNIDSDFVKNNDAFCMAPWSHVHVIPSGNAYPCCLIHGETTLLGNVNETSIEDIWNSEGLKELRLWMLEGKKHKTCDWCYQKEEQFGESFRKDFNQKYANDLSLVNTTQTDGTVEDVQMRYIDIRFSNLCNLKCRMCGPNFSSQFAAESGHRPAIKKVPDGMIGEVYKYLETCEEIYFAGGEPLMMDEHYLLLEKMIELGVKPRIRYNSNITKLKHKHWDILELWKNFDDVYIQASIDGFEDELTYIRHPAKYNEIIETALMYLSVPNVRIDISSCIGFWNIWSLPELHNDLLNKGVISNYENFRFQPMIHPYWFTAKVLPTHIKEQVATHINHHIDFMVSKNVSPSYIDLWKGIVTFMNAEDHFDKWVEKGIDEIKNRDIIRNEDFATTFPKLKEMLNV